MRMERLLGPLHHVKMSKLQPESKEVESASQHFPEKDISFLSELLGRGNNGIICVRVLSVSQNLRSRNGWSYRKLKVKDKSMAAEMLVSEEKYSSWGFQSNDCIICRAKSNGVDGMGKLTFFFDEFLGPFDSSEILFSLTSSQYDAKGRAAEKMKSSETVYQISAREIKSLLELIKLWAWEGKPQHYTKWCQMHQIVATNLYYMGLVKRTAPMSGFYYPTNEALEFFEGKRSFAKKRVYVRDKEGGHLFVSEEGDSKSFSQYLSDHADRESALAEYSRALESYRMRRKSNPEDSSS